MILTQIGKFIEIIHDATILCIFIPFISNNRQILTYNLYFLLFIYIGWIICRNKCWLTLLK